MKTALFFALIFSFCIPLFSCRLSLQKKQRVHEEKIRALGRDAAALVDFVCKKKSSSLESFVASLSEQERLSQLFVINLEGFQKFWFVERAGQGKDQRPLVPGGYIFFSFNIADTPEKIAAFTDSVRGFSQGENLVEPFLCLDAEGGYVNRLRGIAGPLPENLRVSKCLPVSVAEDLYRLNAIQLRALGFDLNLAPVCETVTEQNEKFLDGRSFGTAKEVSSYGAAAVLSYQANGVGAVLKHFPGNNDTDPHFSLPRIHFSEAALNKDVLFPFGNLIECSPTGVLMSLASCTTDSYMEDRPASLSDFWIQKILLGRLGFKGIVFSDDIFMDALNKNGFPPEKAVKDAILSGVNCILMSEKRFLSEYKIVQKLYRSDPAFRARADESVKKILLFKLNCGILEYDYAGEKILVKRRHGLPNMEERINAFYGAKEKNVELYEKYFRATADQNELRAMGR